MTDRHEGGCFCGAVRFRTTGPAKRVSACSCRWCQKRTGSVLGLSVYFEKADVTFLAGEMQTFRLTSDAGRWIETSFCPTCGTTLGWTLEFFPDYQGLSGGTFDAPEVWYPPERYVYARTKPDWIGLPEHIETFEKLP